MENKRFIISVVVLAVINSVIAKGLDLETYSWGLFQGGLIIGFSAIYAYLPQIREIQRNATN